MVRLAISVEGVTEERFVAMVLAPHLQGTGIYAIPISLDGNISIGRVSGELRRLAGSFDKVTTLYDFYGFKRKSENEDKASLEAKIKNCLADNIQGQVIPYIQMHEFEGLLFTSPDAIENNIGQNGLSDWARSILSEFDNNPEMINDSEQTAPSKRLLRQSRYSKSTHGPNICKEIGLAELRRHCSGFNDWVSALEELANL